MCKGDDGIKHPLKYFGLSCCHLIKLFFQMNF